MLNPVFLKFTAINLWREVMEGKPLLFLSRANNAQDQQWL